MTHKDKLRPRDQWDDRQDAIKALQGALSRHPYLRVGQLLVNAYGTDPFYMTDVEFAARLDVFIGESVDPKEQS